MRVLVLAEHDGHRLKTAVLQAVTAAQTWAAPIDVLVIGHNTGPLAAEAAKITGVHRVLHSDAPHWQHPLAEDVAALLVQLSKDYTVIVAGHSSMTKDILPRVAALLDVAMISDAVAVQAPATYTRPIYAGSIYATVESIDPIQVVTVRGSKFAAASNNGAAEIVTIQAPPPVAKTQWISEQRSTSERPELTTARVVVAGGRSLGSAEQFMTVLEPLAEKLGAALGATRAAVDAGFAPNEIQVGQTGTIVAPELYIAIGVSGAVQHTAGMKDSKIVVAINQDPDAAIFQVADYGLVADLFQAVPALITTLNK